MLVHMKELLARAADKTNDSSEEKHVTAFLNDIIEDLKELPEQDQLGVLRASCVQMREFCQILIEKIDKE